MKLQQRKFLFKEKTKENGNILDTCFMIMKKRFKPLLGHHSIAKTEAPTNIVTVDEPEVDRKLKQPKSLAANMN